MKVKELIEKLGEFNPEDDVAMEVIGNDVVVVVADCFTFNDGIVFMTGFKSNLKN